MGSAWYRSDRGGVTAMMNAMKNVDTGPTKSQIASRAKKMAKQQGAISRSLARKTALNFVGMNDALDTIHALDQKVERKVIEKALKKALRVVRKGIKSHVPVMVKFAKRLVGINVGQRRGKEWQSKVGFGVGRATPGMKKRLRSGKNTYTSKEGVTKDRGVGITSANIHWPVFGTAERRTEKGRETGRMPVMLDKAVPAGWTGSKNEFIAVMREIIDVEIERELAKRAAKSGN